jgi:hypothetical protein
MDHFYSSGTLWGERSKACAFERGQIIGWEDRGHWVKKSGYALDMEGSFSHFSKFKRPRGWGKYKRKKGEKECTKNSWL